MHEYLRIALGVCCLIEMALSIEAMFWEKDVLKAIYFILFAMLLQRQIEQ